MTSDDTSIEAMRICISIPYRKRGGMYTFLQQWRSWLDSKGIWHTDDPQAEYDVLFINSFMVPYDMIARVKRSRPHVLVVQRVDGSTRDYGRFDDSDKRQARANMLTDLTIFQSEYSRYSATTKFKVIKEDGPIIYNPVDIENFRPNGQRLEIEGRIKVCNASFSTNPKKGTWKIGMLAHRNPDVTFVLCGRYPDLPDLPNILLMGHLDRTEIATAMRSCNLFLHLAENDPCPNVVLEALSSGLPVLYEDSGGTPELVGACGLPVMDSSFRQQLEAILTRREDLSKAARERAEKRFSPNRIFPQYMEAMALAKRRPLPSWWDFVRVRLKGYPVLPDLLRKFIQEGRHSLMRKLLKPPR